MQYESVNYADKIYGRMWQGHKKSITVIDGKIIEQVSDFICLGNMISEFKTDIATKIHLCNETNSIIKRYLVKI
jgi:hypothetical protein